MAVTVTNPAPRRWVATWPDPDDDEVVRWEVVWKQGATVKETVYVRNNRSVYRAPAADKFLNHQVTVKAINGLGVYSAGSTGNVTGTEDDTTAEDPGTIKKHGGPSTPGGWLRCNGDSYATSSYSGLFGAIGYTYGGSGANFLVPDFRGRHPMGVGSTSSLGGNEGAAETARGAGHDHGTHAHGHGHGSHAHGHDHGTHAHGHGHGTHGHGHGHGGAGGGHSHNAGSLSTSSASGGQGQGGSGSPNDLTRIGHTHSVTGDTGSQDSTHSHNSDSTVTTPASDATGGALPGDWTDTSPGADYTAASPGSTSRPHLRVHFIIKT